LTQESEIYRLLDQVLEHLPDSKQGLPQEVFYFLSQLTPLINVDLLIKDKAGRTLLTWRDDNYYGPAWHIPGGVIRFKELIEDRIIKVAESELGASVRFAPEPINVRGLIHPERDIRGHFISLLYLCELTSKPDPLRSFETGYSPKHGQWAWHERAPNDLLRVHEPFRKFIDETLPL
jgi:ADP-ribose pyrophosphatase YjhB (NUDIX family)